MQRFSNYNRKQQKSSGNSLRKVTVVCSALISIASILTVSSSANAQCGPNRFATTGNLRYERAVQQKAVLLNNGKVLVIGGASSACSPSSTTNCAKNQSAELYDPATGQFTSVDLKHSVTAMTVTVLGNGKVLIAGGYDVYAGTMSRTASLYDPNSGNVTDTGALSQARGFHSATMLGNGKVLIAGGQTTPTAGSYTASAELYDPNSGTFSTISNMTAARGIHTSTLLNDGRVLIVSGFSSDIYDPNTSAFVAGPRTTYLRSHHTATRLMDGLVLLAGGDLDPATQYGNTEAELFNPSTNTFNRIDTNGATGAMVRIRHGHSATLLPNGKVLIAGGHDGSASDPYYWRYSDTTEVFDPVTRRFTLSVNLARSRSGHTATLMNDGRILMAGGGGFVSGTYYDSYAFTEVSDSSYCTGTTYLGCYTDDANRAMPVRLMSSGATVESCTSAAATRGFPYAALEWYGACLAGFTPSYNKTNEGECNTRCTANQNEWCGGAWRSSMYRTNLALSPITTGNVGCFTDDPTRDLDAMLISSGATVESCVTAAKARGFKFAGLQWHGQCFAGNTHGTAAGVCDTKCDANPSENCGGSYANNVWETGITPVSVQNPQSLYLGCFSDDANHALDAVLITSGATIESCIAAAKSMGYSYAGLQWYGVCQASNILGYSRVGEDKCDRSCTANPAQKCGGEWFSSMYQVPR
jgi:sulfur relay (sulfurtransferase) complex TusBCD TusD component (DsrE family)